LNTLQKRFNYEQVLHLKMTGGQHNLRYCTESVNQSINYSI